ncbi:MAG: sugar phosphate isomerase/epimerase family protein [Capsulimonadales bacterium]|nr:sugar phosphate isomerase/epimerase family protein [Capsulimonadales bacterium]
MATRTGNFAIGFRKGWSEWQRDTAAAAKWASENGFEALDLGQPSAEDIDVLKAHGLKLGTVDFPGGWTDSEPVKRKEAGEKAAAYIKEKADLGAKLFFTILPGDASRSRAENYRIALEGFAPVAEAANSVDAYIVIEGWPGGGSLPHLACNPETYRSVIKDIGLPSVAINYDPSHLIRMGIDHIRFLNEFLPHVRHVHGKDTELFPEKAYELGLYQNSAFESPFGYGEHVWRYTIPGHGVARWTEIFKILAAGAFSGIVSVELEDGNFNGSAEGEKSGLLHSLNFLRSA